MLTLGLLFNIKRIVRPMQIFNNNFLTIIGSKILKLSEGKRSRLEDGVLITLLGLWFGIKESFRVL